MNIQIFGKNKCFDTRKAERYFKERRIPFQSIDLKRYGMSGKEFDSVRRAVGGIDQLIDWYFTEGCDADTRLKIYCYVALGGLLWSNWCEYKKELGVDFGGYALMQYRYASEYSALFQELIKKRNGGK